MTNAKTILAKDSTSAVGKQTKVDISRRDAEHAESEEMQKTE